MPNVTDTTRAEAWETLRITSWERFGAHLGSWRLLLVTDARDGALQQALRQSGLGSACEVAWRTAAPRSQAAAHDAAAWSGLTKMPRQTPA